MSADENRQNVSERVYRKTDVAQHRTVEDGVWVSFGDGVYDVTNYLVSHPGGSDRILEAAGGDLSVPWRNTPFQRHLSSPVVSALLKERRIGTLHPDDMVELSVLPEDPLVYSDDSVYDVVIVGAGLSGLQCAKSLTAEYGLQKEKILILEAQEYIGGRVRQVVTSMRLL